MQIPNSWASGNQISQKSEHVCVNVLDTNKTKLGAPLLPNTLSETLEALKRCATFIAFVLGPECPYGKACKAVINVLQRKYELFYKMGAQFGPSYGHEILYQLHLVAIEFFGSTTMEEEYEAGMPHPGSTGRSN